LNPVELDLPYDDNFEEEDYAYEEDGYYDDEDYEDYP
jgi:hypothetical protein